MTHTIIIPQNTNAHFSIPKKLVGKKLRVSYEVVEEKIEKHTKKSDSYALAGKPLSNDEFKNWAKKAEKNNSITLKEAEKIWATKRKQLKKLIK